MIRIRVSDVQEHLEELIDAKLTVHIIDNEDYNKILAIMVPIEEYEEIQEDIARLEGLMK